MMKKILLIAGEVSADQHGAELVSALSKLDNEMAFFGIGGEELEKQGMQLFYHNSDLAFLGLVEVLKHLPFIKKVHHDLIKWVEREKPDAAILIDYPGFNLRLAKSLKKRNIPVIYYISPQLWAWGKGRVKKIRKYVDKMLVLFPFEKTFYAEYGIKAEYVGHPLVDKHSNHLREQPRTISPDKKHLGILPGSRKQEVIALLPGMLQTAKLLFEKKVITDAEIVRVGHLNRNIYDEILTQHQINIPLIEKPLYEVLPYYDAVIAASGTVTLETGLFRLPTLVVYKVNALTYWLGRVLVKVRNIGLINIVAEKQVAPELIQHDFEAQRAAQILEEMFDPENNVRIRDELRIISQKLSRTTFSQTNRCQSQSTT